MQSYLFFTPDDDEVQDKEFSNGEEPHQMEHGLELRIGSTEDGVMENEIAST